MINIIKDFSKQYVSNFENIIVKNMDSYFLARKEFFKKYKEKIHFEIIIRREIYFPYFLDLEEYKNVIVRDIRKDEKESILIIDSFTDIFEALLKIKSKYSEDSKIVEILKKDYLKSYKILNDKKNIDECILQLVKGYIFSKYKEYNFNLLMGDECLGSYFKIKNDIELEKSFIQNKKLIKNYIDVCNQYLKENSKKIAIFSNFPNLNYLEEIFGELDVEEEYYIVKNIEALNNSKQYNEILNNIEYGEKKFNKQYDDIKKLIINLQEIERSINNSKKNIDEWKEYFIQYYIKYNNLSEKSNILNIIEVIEKKYKSNLHSLKMRIENTWKMINSKFEIYFFENYEALYSSSYKYGLDYILSKNYKHFKTKKNIFLFIDCLRFDIWQKVKSFLIEKSYVCQHEEIVLSAIPTVTSYCKKILYTGKKYNQIKNNDMLTPLKSIFYDKEILKIDSFDNINNLTEDIFLHEILDLDNFFHNIKDLTEEYLKQNIELKLKKILEKIDINKFNIIIMTDHGATKLQNNGLSFFKEKDFILENNLKIENHGRYIKIYSSFYNEDIYKVLKESLNNNKDIYVIDRENMSNFYLEITEKEKENYFYLLFKYGKYPKKTGEFNHGGISLEEVMISFGIFSTDKKKYIPIDLEVKSKEIENKNKAELEIVLKNENIIENFKIKLKYQEKEKIIKKLDGSKILQFYLDLDVDIEGELREIAEISFNIDGKIYELEKVLKFKVKKNKVEKLNKKLKSSRGIL